MSSIYLEKEGPNQHLSPREPEHLKMPKKKLHVSRDQAGQPLLPTEETVLHNENYDNFHQVSPGMRASSANTYRNIPPEKVMENV